MGGGDSNGHEQFLHIIKVPYREGKHCATKLSQFIPIINQLKFLHSKNYVHGDIRAFNMVFGTNSSYLIDFDFGGEKGTACFPKGYVKNLPSFDGFRIFSDGETIEERHDWYALIKVMFTVHQLKFECTTLNDFQCKSKIEDFVESICNELANESNFNLETFIAKFHDNVLRHGNKISFQQDGTFALEYNPENASISKCGTGSPLKKDIDLAKESTNQNPRKKAKMGSISESATERPSPI